MNKHKMSSDEKADKVALLFQECLEIPDPMKREIFLNSACAGDAKLRVAVEKLLLAHEDSGDFLTGGSPPMGSARDGADDLPGYKPGEFIGKYRLMGLIGEGSTSTVFLAEQEEPIRRWVALKIVKPGMDTRKVILRFGLERQALALMDHPGIAKLLDAGATPNGRPFFVMELVSGLSITHYCDENQLTLPKRLQLFIQICNAVFHAHQRGIIHRDLKPDNILVSNVDGQTVLKIVDFGIAKVLHSWSTDNATRTSLMPFLGTPAYMSPEQVQMNSAALDTRTDIYSLGALLYELLCAHPPFDPEYLVQAGLEEMCRIIRTQEPVAPSLRFTNLPEDEQAEVAHLRGCTVPELKKNLIGDLDWITLKALEKMRGCRYGTSSSLARDITCHFEHLPVSAAKPSRRYKFAKLMKRKRKLMIAGTAMAAMLLISTILLTTMGISAHINAKQAIQSELAASRAQKQSHKAMIAMHVSSGLSAIDNNRPDQAVLWFATAALEAGEDNPQSEVNARRSISWLNEAPMPIGALKISSNFRQLEFSNDSRFLLALGNDRTWQLWDSRSRDILRWTANIGRVEKAAWSPTGASLALILSSGEIRVYDVPVGQPTHVINPPVAPESIGFTPDSRYLVFGNSSLHVFDLVEGSMKEEIPQLANAFAGFSFGPQSSQVVGVTHDGWASIFSIDGGNGMEPESYPHRAAIRSEVCSSESNYQEEFLKTPRVSMPLLVSNGERLLTRTGVYEISLWNLETGQRIQKVDEACCSCGFVTNSKSGLVACGLQGGKVGLWDVKTGEPYQMLPSQGACILDIDFGMQGHRLATGDANGMARIWSVKEGKEIQPAMHHCTDVDWIAYCETGRMVATAQPDGLVRIWNVAPEETTRFSMPGTAVPTSVSMNADGGEFLLTRNPGWVPSPKACIRQATIYSATSGNPIGTTLPGEGCVESASFSPHASLVAIGMAACDSPERGRVDFYTMEKELTHVEGFSLSSAPGSISWNPVYDQIAVICHSGELFVARGDMDNLRQWSPPTASPGQRNNLHVEFTGDGRTLVSLGPDGKIHVRDAATGSIRYPPLESAPNGFWSFALSKDNRHMATTTMGGQVTIWDLTEGIPAGSQLTHPSWVYRCRFAPDQDSIITAAHDGKVRLWNWRTGQLLAEPMTHPSEVYDATFTPDMRLILTACRDGNLRIWERESSQILLPPINVGQQAFNIEITTDGNHAVIGNLGDKVTTIALAGLKEPLPYDVNDLRLIAEVISSSTIQNGTVRDLTTTEWLDRYGQLRQLHPEALHPGNAPTITRLSFKKGGILPTTIGPVGLVP
jgi:serine/threonine protein kinase